MAAWREVLRFWFGAVPAGAHSNEGCSAGPAGAVSSARASAEAARPPPVETHIKRQYSALWFPSSSSGAQAEADSLVADKFKDLLNEAERGVLRDSWSTHPLSLCALIIVLDQFSRHVYRNAVRPAENDAEALALANLMLQRQWHLELPVPLAVFSLMPLRHTPTIPRLERVVREIESRGARLQSAQHLLEKFRRATASRSGHAAIWRQG